MSVQDEHGYHDANARKEPALLTEQDAAALKAIRCTVHPLNGLLDYRCRYHPATPEAGQLCPAHQAKMTATHKQMEDWHEAQRGKLRADNPPLGAQSKFRIGLTAGLNVGLDAAKEEEGRITMPVGATAADRLWPLTDERVDAFMEKAAEDAQEARRLCPAHYAGAVTPWDLQKSMKSSGNAFVDARRADAIEYAFRLKGDLLGDLIKARHCLDEAITVLKAQKNK